MIEHRLKILLLGNSDTSGRFALGQTWPEIVAEGLAVRLGQPTDMRQVPFVVLNPGSAAYAEREVRAFEPDLVLLPVGTAMFTVGFVWKRVETLFGKRAARWFRRAEDRFDARTRDRGRRRGAANAAARKTLRRVIGTQTLSSQQQVTDGFRATIDTLARFEQAQVALIVTAPRGAHHHRPGAKERRRAFLHAVEASATNHHFAWIETDRAYDGVTSDAEMKNQDGLHQTPAGHQMLGNFLLDRIGTLTGVLVRSSRR
jgi:hypothetical protein